MPLKCIHFDEYCLNDCASNLDRLEKGRDPTQSNDPYSKEKAKRRQMYAIKMNNYMTITWVLHLELSVIKDV